MLLEIKLPSTNIHELKYVNNDLKIVCYKRLIVKLKYILVKRILVLLIVSSVWHSGLHSQSFTSDYQRVLELIQQNHLQPLAIDDSLSARVFKMFFETIDPNAILFTSEQIDAFKHFQYQLDDILHTQSDTFVQEVAAMLKVRIPEVKLQIHELLYNAMDFGTDEYFIVMRFKAEPFQTEAEYNNWLRKYLKAKMLYEMAETYLFDTTIISYFFPNNSIFFEERHFTETHLRVQYKNADSSAAKVQKKQFYKLDKILNQPDLAAYLSNVFLKSLMACCDPHSDYFSAQEYLQFKSHLSAGKISLGLGLTENQQGEIEIAELVPGGPAWNTNQLNAGDVIISIQWQDEPEISITGIGLRAVEELLNRPDKTRIKLKVQKANQSVIAVELVKIALLSNDELVQSFVLNGIRKIGYISLPGFYSNYDNSKSYGCANDVTKEILKLKKEEVSGIILDLRNNRGGSVKEAIELVGIFIDYGPVIIWQKNKNETGVVNDFNRGSAYKGPLVILINGYSASASELVSGALKTYNRALIVGEKSYGKSTSQIILPIDTTITDQYTNPGGHVKITTGRVFDITGQSNQGNGVEPHIRFNAPHRLYQNRESFLDYAFPPFQTNKKAVFNPLPPLPSALLFDKYIARNGSYLYPDNNPDAVATINMADTIPLEKSQYTDFLKQEFQEFGRMESYPYSDYGTYSVTSNRFDQRINFLTPEAKEVFLDYCRTLKEDREIEEAYYIINDYINLINSSK